MKEEGKEGSREKKRKEGLSDLSEHFKNLF